MTAQAKSETDLRIARAAAALRRHHSICAGLPRPVPIWRDLDLLRDWLDAARNACRQPPDEAEKAAEWLLDNEYHIRRAIRQVRTDMPTDFYRRLPSLAAPDCHGLPRVFLAAGGYLDITHAQIGLGSLIRFTTAYQGEDGLRIAELWAFPVMLRLNCLQSIVLAISELFPALKAPFDPGPGVAVAATRDPTETMSRAIVALAAIARIPWKAFVEETSHIEAILRGAPDGLHAAMDFATRDMYRRAVEDLAESSDWSEPQIAAEAVRLCANHAGAARKSHAGWWLVGGGRDALERTVGFQPRLTMALRRFVLAHAGKCYAAALISFSLLALTLPFVLLYSQNVAWPIWIAAALLFVLPASIIGLTLTNWIATLTIPSRALPKMSFREGLPEGYASAIIVPVIFRHSEEIPPLMAQLEKHWLTNPDPRLRLVLLSDLGDAPRETLPDDLAIEASLQAGIEALNRRYAEHAPFVLLHRHRRWNAAEGTWMGWERKRGKIEEFNELLQGEGDPGFHVTGGNVAGLSLIQFVVTLDADTEVPPGAIQRLLGTLAHPLNRPEFDPSGTRVVAGYTFIQPRIEISPAAGSASLFARLFTGDTAIDIYSRAVSDVYQDLFGEAIFTGKGAYDVTAFRQSLAGRVPENALVSHDLFEGLHGRAALASDIVFYEGFPARYPEYARRLHRWIRGDWQLLPWLSSHPPGRGGQRLSNPLSRVDRWKILDNLRRSLIAPALVLLALFGWLAMPHAAPFWTVLTVTAPGFFLFTNLVMGVSRGRRRGAVRNRARQLLDHAGRWALEVIFMANQAVLSLDAIMRTLWRLNVSRKQMLEWVTAAHVAAAGSDSRSRFWSEMAGGPILGLALVAVVATQAPAALPGALPLLVLWILSPEIARLIGRPRQPPVEALAPEDRRFLRQLARRTWLYFETFAGPGDNWLPPDNYQAPPHEEIAHRTSPTNIGMQFLSSLTALDLGHAGLRDVAARTVNALVALDRLERHRGHVLNWFDTLTLTPLEPRYVSTVDSGNLAVALLTLREGFLEAAEGPALSPARWDGLIDTLSLLGEALAALPPQQAAPLQKQVEGMIAAAHRFRDAPADWANTVNQLQKHDLPSLSEKIPAALDAASATDPQDIHLWLERSQHHLNSLAHDFKALFPWLALLAAPPAGQEGAAERIAALLPPDLPLGKVVSATVMAKEALTPGQSTEQWHADLCAAIDRGVTAQMDLRDSLLSTAERAENIAAGMDFGFLYDRETLTFYIGYNLSLDRIDEHRYDLLASEARLASYFAIAKGDVPAEHWFHLGRPMSRDGGALTVLSWNGSMFEYLMPGLLLRSAPGQLLGQSEATAVELQKRYGDKLGLPWGVSEAAFAARDSAQRYQYRAFGVPGLGMKQGLAENYVVAPYASALALSVRPGAALKNLRWLRRMGLLGRYGFYDAVDFTPSRVAESDAFTPVRTFMAHHQGMLLSAIDNALCNDALVRRFNRNARIAAINLLLHERVPWEYLPEPLPDTGTATTTQKRRPVPKLRGWPAGEADAPQLHAFGNGRLSVRVDETGRSSLWWHGQSLTRWSADPAAPAGAARLFLRDTDDDTVWEFGRHHHQWADVTFHPERASFHLRHNGIAATQEIVVAMADDVEIRHITLINHSNRSRVIDVTSYAEPVLASPAAHERHPAFSKLFLRSAHLPDLNALLFTRQPRRPGDQPPALLHGLIAEDPAVHHAGFDTDRRAVLGRHGDPSHPEALHAELTGTVGWTLDPVAALRAQVRLAPGDQAQLAFVTVAAGSAATAMEIADRYTEPAALNWTFEDAAHTAAVAADRLGATQSDLQTAQALSRHLVLPPLKRAEALHEPLPGQPDLWGLGLSGDLPIVMVRVAAAETAALLPSAVRVHHWWRRNGLLADLVILGTTASSYEAPIRSRLGDALREAGQTEGLGGLGGIHLHSVDRITPEQRRALEGLAHLVLDGSAQTLNAALPPSPPPHAKQPLFSPGARAQPTEIDPIGRPTDLLFDNGTGGFSSDGHRYVIHLAPDCTTPVPWCNVLANDGFGTIVSEAGLGFSWSLNSGEHRLTPWSNDPVTDAQGEALYLRDEETAEIWTPTPLPAGDGSACRITHGTGRSDWACNGKGLEQRLTVVVPPDAPVKLVRLRLANPGKRPRRITATYYAEWQLGALPSMARPRVVCGYHGAARALVARNGWSPEFGARVAFLTASRPAHSLTCERGDFLGMGDPRRPEGLQRWNLGARTEAITDPCGAFQVHLDLPPGGSEDVIFVLGDAPDMASVETLAAEWSAPARFELALEETQAIWDRRLGAVRVETADPSFDLMVNRWLPYQAFASRILARAGFSQAGGGIGFRDQLQDMMAFLISEPARVRAHILDCAARQFEEGDVLHWWHPPGGRGVRTRCSDDMMWLVYATHGYVAATGDVAILHEEVRYLTAPPLADDEDDRYAAFDTSPRREKLIDHCRRALERGLTSGPHGLPLIGAGDWNDGMDRVGHRGFGESVWLAWFASLCSDGFADLAGWAGSADLAPIWRKRADALRRVAETAGWDGGWYLRAFDDDGAPWGSAGNTECRIDSIAQSWSVLAGAPDTARATQAMQAAATHLVDHNLRLVRLLTPPFETTPRDPGYIRAYPPGVRENGGQYSHAAMWLGLAFARLGDAEAARGIFDLVNPILRSATARDAAHYRGEPYVMPADVGGAPPFEGRAGWTWYTGAAAWAWRLAVEGILGLELRGGKLRLAPCLAPGAGNIRAVVQGPNGTLEVNVIECGMPDGTVHVEVDGQPHPEPDIAFPDDGSTRTVRVMATASWRRPVGSQGGSHDQSDTERQT